MKQLITTDTLRNLPPGKDVWDTKLPGFLIRVHRSGHASYLVSLGRRDWYTIDRVERLSLPEARREARVILGEAAKGVSSAKLKRRKKAGHTLKSYLRDHYGPWLTSHRPGSADHTLRRIERQFLPSLGSTPLVDLTGFAVQKWRSARLRAGRSHGTVNRDLAALRAALSRAVEWDFLTAHPLAKVKALKEDKIRSPRHLVRDEENRLRDALAARDARRRTARDSANTWRQARRYSEWPDYGTYTDLLTPLVLTALHTGCRFGELANLTWADVNLSRALLTLRGTGTKSGHTRHLPLNAEAHSVLVAWQRSSESSGYVFPGKNRGRLVDIKTAWAKLLRDARIDRFRFHDCRHDFASKLVMAGVDLNTVRELLGHADIKMVLRYAHLAPEHLAAAVDKLVRRA